MELIENTNSAAVLGYGRDIFCQKTRIRLSLGLFG